MEHEVSFRKRVAGEPVTLRVAVADGATLLEAAHRAGLPMAQACGANALCARCCVQILDGAEALSAEHETERRTKERNELPTAWRLACQAKVHGPTFATTTYW